MTSEGQGASRRGVWRLASAVPLPLLILLYAVWTDLVTLDGTGFHVTGTPGDAIEWGTMSLGTALLVAAFWAAFRPLRILAAALYSLMLAFGFGAAGVVAIVHAFGGPRGDLVAPTWALVALGVTSALCALALLALAALLVDDVRAADAGEP
ncbi:MAG: hypothetical protein LJF15_00700 [Acidobacteria bacterium]|jgi:hypothetical protein|nr:hypothetical protein [Acidobacteriota bacterium]